jgi:hypothetical protein
MRRTITQCVQRVPQCHWPPSTTDSQGMPPRAIARLSRGQSSPAASIDIIEPKKLGPRFVPAHCQWVVLPWLDTEAQRK